MGERSGRQLARNKIHLVVVCSFVDVLGRGIRLAYPEFLWVSAQVYNQKLALAAVAGGMVWPHKSNTCPVPL